MGINPVFGIGVKSEKAWIDRGFYLTWEITEKVVERTLKELKNSS